MKTSVILTILLFILCSCTSANPISDYYHQNRSKASCPSCDSSPDYCIKSLITFAYPKGEFYDHDQVPENPEVLPGEPWKFISTCPVSSPDIDRETQVRAIIRSNNGIDNLWLFYEESQEVYVYNLLTGNWKSITLKNSPQKNSSFLVNSDNSLWALKGDFGDYSLIQKYNDKTNEFDSIIDIDKVLITDTSDLLIVSYGLDSQEKIWMVILSSSYRNDSGPYFLLSYDPKTNHAATFDFDFRYDGTLAIGPNDTIFLMGGDKRNIYEFNSQNSEIKNYKFKPNAELYEGLFLFYDNQNHLWVSDTGWMDFSDSGDFPTWYEIIRPPNFLTYVQAQGLWLRGNPRILFETDNSRYWFKFANGNGWVDVNLGKWCIFTTYTSDMVKDMQDNIWMFIFPYLYKYENN